MKTIRNLVSAVLLVLAGSVPAVADFTAPPGGWPIVDGMLGLETDDGRGWLAIRVDFPDSTALSEVLWYNNDGLESFPRLLVGTGYPEGPATITSATVMAEGVVGASDGWSQCILDQPVAASMGKLYVILEFPAGDGYTSRGAGGGPAVGFSSELIEPYGWISGDGETWHALSEAYSFAIIPVTVPVTDGMFVKSLGEVSDGGAPEVPDHPYITAGPNPFNPKVVVRFGMPRPGEARLDVFDVHGRRVVRLVDESLPAGHHEISWAGKDGRGRGVASGVYFLHLQALGENWTQRVTMVK